MEDNKEIELKEYWAIIRKWWVMIVSITLVATLVSGIASEFFIKPTYEESATLLVNQKMDSTQLALSALYSSVQANESLITTYSDIMNSNAILNPTIQKLNLPYKTSQLAKMISLTSNNQSEVITLSVKANSPDLAAKIANTLASIFQRKVVQLMQVSNVQVVDPAVAQANPSPVSPNKKMNVAIAFVLGLMVSVGIAFLLEYMDDSVRSEEEVAQILGVPVLGVVPLINQGQEKKATDQVSETTTREVVTEGNHTIKS
jgi:capsular polysaccharide biosynthesis protein